jgi:type IV pilus assembly protein PilN
VVLVHGVIAGYISQQESKNAYLKKEIAALDKEIDEIKRLKEQTRCSRQAQGRDRIPPGQAN